MEKRRSEARRWGLPSCMAIFQVATNHPSKAEIISGWIGDQPWGRSAERSIEVVGSFHLEDAEGQVGMQVHIVASAGVASCGYGQTLGFARINGRWNAWPESAKVHGYGAVAGRVLVDRFERVATESTDVVVRNEHLEATVFRALADRPLPIIGMAATWPGQPDPVVLASVVELDR
ncbi:MAG: hypothetical protein R2754_18935 [Microthrixaceae bacterium]